MPKGRCHPAGLWWCSVVTVRQQRVLEHPLTGALEHIIGRHRRARHGDTGDTGDKWLASVTCRCCVLRDCNKERRDERCNAVPYEEDSVTSEQHPLPAWIGDEWFFRHCCGAFFCKNVEHVATWHIGKKRSVSGKHIIMERGFQHNPSMLLTAIIQHEKVN